MGKSMRSPHLTTLAFLWVVPGDFSHSQQQRPKDPKKWIKKSWISPLLDPFSSANYSVYIDQFSHKAGTWHSHALDSSPATTAAAVAALFFPLQDGKGQALLVPI